MIDGSIKPASDHDVMLWPDGTWCYREDLEEYSHMSDDYQVIPVNTPSHAEFFL